MPRFSRESALSVRLLALLLAVAVIATRIGASGEAQAASAPSITVSPPQVAPNSYVTVAGQGFSPGLAGRIELDGRVLTSFVAASDGSFNRSVYISLLVTSGTHQMTATLINLTQSASTSLVVGDPGANPTATPTSVPPTATATAPPPTNTPGQSPTPTNTPTSTATSQPTNTPVSSPTFTATSAPTQTARATSTPTSLPTSTPTSTWTPSPTATWTSTPASSPTPTSTATPAPAGQVALGVYVPGAPWDMSPISAYDQEVGHPPKIIMWFQDWLYPYPQPAVANVLASGAAAELTWEPWDSSNGSANQPTYKLTNITRGDFDTYIHQFAHDAAASHQRLYLRFAHEMDGYWYPWGTAPGNQYTPPNPLGNTPQDYVNAWRHVHDIFVQEGATNVAWVWAPNLDYTGGAPFAQDYPGDAYVDYLGLSGYNRGTTQQWFTWESFDQLYSSSYAMLTAITSKPIIISEIASVEQGGDKAQWITQGFLTTIPQSYPQIRGIVWDDSPPGSQWTVDSSPAALAAWQEVAAAPYYQGTLP